MTEKQEYALNKIITALPDDCRNTIREIAEYAMSLGYMPSLKNKGEDYADFSKAKVKRTILKISTNPKFPFLSMKFYAMPTYTGIFQEALEERIRYYSKLKYEIKVDCVGCMHSRSGKCKMAQGYTFVFPDGRQGFICGYCVIPLPLFTAENVSEVKEALKIQDEFFMK